MHHTVTVREATEGDLQAILDIYNDAVLNTTASYDEVPRTLEERTLWYHDHRRQNFPIFVAVDSEEAVLGWSSLSAFHPRIGYRFTAENSIYISAAHRG